LQALLSLFDHAEALPLHCALLFAGTPISV